MAQSLPSKEQSLFRHLVQNYESKQYKKGIKAAEQILKKHPTHGDTQAMKALILNNQGKQDEAFELCKLALRNSMKSHVCWHVYGLLWRSVKNYDEAIKAYRFALKLDPDSQQIQRDLALLQVQMRDYPGYVQSRTQMLQLKPQLRQNWTALAVAHHLNGELDKAENILRRFEETLKQPPPKSDLEHAEAVLYKNSIIAEQGDYARALEQLNTISRSALDRTAVMEARAEYLLKLERREDAQKAYRALLDRNTEKQAYFDGLEKALGLGREKMEDQEKLRELYQSYAEKSSRIDAARRIPLDFLHGDAFRMHADAYLRGMFAKGVPSAFANVKQLYTDSEKRDIIQELVEGYAKEEPQVNGGAEKREPNGTGHGKQKEEDAPLRWPLSVNYFLAQHYNYYLSRDLAKAQKYCEKAISLNPSKTDYTYHMTRARVLKNLGDVAGASNAMNAAREMDLKDRYINTKCAKYQLRNDENQTAVETMGLFTRKEAVGGPLGDLLDMQCVWYITEDGESYFRQGKLSLALKRFKAVYNIFDVWIEDQFDFHNFSLRKGMIRAYVDMIRWADNLREHPFYARAALSAIRIHCMLQDRPELATGGSVNGTAESAAEKKKVAKKARKETEDEGATKTEDSDPLGVDALKAVGENPLAEAMKFVAPLLELTPKNIDAQAAGFEVFIRRKKYLPALRCLLAIQALDPEDARIHEFSGRLKHALDTLPEPLPQPAQQVVAESFLSKQSSSSLEEQNEQYLQHHRDSAPHVQGVVRLRHVLHPGDETMTAKSVKDLQSTIDSESCTIKEAVASLQLLRELRVIESDRQAFIDVAQKKWPEATVFKV